MPELPEVETTRRGIAPMLHNRVPRQVVVRQVKLRWPVPVTALQGWCGAPIEQVWRRGKWLGLSSDNGHVLIHLGMSGCLRIVPADCPVQAHDHVDVVLDHGKVLRYTDPRRFGAWLFTATDPLHHPRLRHLGPEPLSAAFTSEWLARQCSRSRRAIKALIMDSRVVVGVGNIYATEALFRAGIHPARGANTLSKRAVSRLVAEIQAVLAAAIEQGGTTLQDFTRPDGRPGYFAQALQVYGRAGQPCPRCGTLLHQQQIAQRSSVFCPVCQPL